MTIGYPTANKEVHELVNEHLKLTDAPLLLALYFAPAREPQDIFLFEVIEGFGANSVDEDKKLFEVTYSSTAGFPLQPGQKLHLVLTNLPEFEVAIRDHWAAMQEIQAAIKQGDFRVMHESDAYAHLLQQLKS